MHRDISSRKLAHMISARGTYFQLAVVASALLFLFSGLPSAADSTASTAVARARLDHELLYERDTLGIPDTLLQPVIAQEKSVIQGAGWNATSQDTTQKYDSLYTTARSLENTSSQTLHQQASSDIESFSYLLNQEIADNRPSAPVFQSRLDHALRAMGIATLPGDYSAIDQYVQDQITALRALDAATLHLGNMRRFILDLSAVGLPTAQAQVLYTGDQTRLNVVNDTLSATDYTKLSGTIDGQMTQLLADMVEATPYSANAFLRLLQTHITELKQYGLDTRAFQRAYNADAQALASVNTPLGALTLAQQLLQQNDALLLPLAKGKARSDLHTLAQLIAVANTRYIADPFTGQRFPAAYEYANTDQGYGVVEGEVAGSVTLTDYENADTDVAIMTANLQAMLANMNDRTPAGHAHKTDLSLMQRYNLMQGRVVVVSLREQVARFYDHGHLIFWSYVTTGRPELPSPPGLHYAIDKSAPLIFSSSEPRSSPFWFAPTPVQYAILYKTGGFYLHDAWWRHQFGPGTNLSHDDPAAFNGGSHGCINFPKEIMPKVYNFVARDAPILVY